MAMALCKGGGIQAHRVYAERSHLKRKKEYTEIVSWTKAEHDSYIYQKFQKRKTYKDQGQAVEQTKKESNISS